MQYEMPSFPVATSCVIVIFSWRAFSLLLSSTSQLENEQDKAESTASWTLNIYLRVHYESLLGARETEINIP